MLYTYFAFSNERGLVKIGQSRNPVARIKASDIARYGDIFLLAIIRSSDLSEKAAHQIYADKRVEGEWFQCDPDDMPELEQFDQVPVETFEVAYQPGGKSISVSSDHHRKIRKLAKKSGMTMEVILGIILDFMLPKIEAGEITAEDLLKEAEQ